MADAAADGRIGRQATDQLCATLTDIDRLATLDPFSPTPADPIGEDQIIGLLAHGIRACSSIGPGPAWTWWT